MKKVYKGIVHRGVFFSKEVLNTLINFKLSSTAIFNLTQTITQDNKNIDRVVMRNKSYKPLIGVYTLNDLPSNKSFTLLGDGYWGVDNASFNSIFKLYARVSISAKIFSDYGYEPKVIIIDLSSKEYPAEDFDLEMLKLKTETFNIALIIVTKDSASINGLSLNSY
jgi:replication initiation and membrane attachment protein DnaB